MGKIRNLLRIAVVASVAWAAFVDIPDVKAQNVIENFNSSYFGGPTAFSGAGVTNPIQGTWSNMVWFCTSAKGVGAPRIKSIFGLTGDVVANTATFWVSTNFATITNAGIAGTNVLMAPTTGILSNDVAIIHFVGPDVYQLVIVTNVATAGQIGISAGAKYATTTSDVVFKMVQAGSMIEPGATATNITPESGVVFTGRQGYPTAITLLYSNAAKIRIVSGEFGGREPYRRF